MRPSKSGKHRRPAGSLLRLAACWLLLTLTAVAAVRVLAEPAPFRLLSVSGFALLLLAAVFVNGISRTKIGKYERQ